MTSLRGRLEAVARALSEANEEQYVALVASGERPAAMAHPRGGPGSLLQLPVDTLVRELRQQHAANPPPPAVQQNIVPMPSFRPLSKVGRKEVGVAKSKPGCPALCCVRPGRRQQQQRLTLASQCAGGGRRNWMLLTVSSLGRDPPFLQGPLEKETIRPEGTGEEVLLQGFNWDRCAWGGGGGGAGGSIEGPYGVGGQAGHPAAAQQTPSQSFCSLLRQALAPTPLPRRRQQPAAAWRLGLLLPKAHHCVSTWQLPPRSLLSSPARSWKQHGGWFNHVKARAAEVAGLGFTAVWLPPFTQSVSNEVRRCGPRGV